MPRRRSMYSLPKFRLRQKTIMTVGSLVALVLAGLSAVSLLTESTKLTFWRDFLKTNFGWTVIFTPLIFLVVGLVLQKLKFSFAQPNVLVGLLAIVAALSGLTAPINPALAGDLGNFCF